MDLKAIERRRRIKRQNRLGARHKKRGIAEAKPTGKVVSMQSTEAKGEKPIRRRLKRKEGCDNTEALLTKHFSKV